MSTEAPGNISTVPYVFVMANTPESYTRRCSGSKLFDCVCVGTDLESDVVEDTERDLDTEEVGNAQHPNAPSDDSATQSVVAGTIVTIPVTAPGNSASVIGYCRPPFQPQVTVTESKAPTVAVEWRITVARIFTALSVSEFPALDTSMSALMMPAAAS